ncbi:hypothetical protein [Spongiactinospora sp. TRM90649]|uniref:hypothetical protein n=1 Tax=Spongiactinospora sp. TRM90649 TaxID=3031114 RepID=UPI0023F6EF0D|nr:hypothetical protein [Spongiactinospora sp. TRM90649]MDF5758615.1 hypothetical protein [Spongiactinospora sp. TRM90649]
MTTPAPARPHSDAAVAAIEAVVSAQASQILVGRGVQPPGSGWQGEPGASVHRPYVVLYPMTGTPDGSVADAVEYLDYQAQATCIAATQDGAEAVADLVKTAWVNAPLPVVGRASYPGQVQLDRPASRDDTISPSLHYAVVQVSWRTQRP